MAWIRTQKGWLLNLDHIAVFNTAGGKVSAHDGFPEGSSYVVADGLTDEETAVLMDVLAQTLTGDPALAHRYPLDFKDYKPGPGGR